MCSYASYKYRTVLLLCTVLVGNSITATEALNYKTTLSTPTSRFRDRSLFPSTSAFYIHISNGGVTRAFQPSPAKERETPRSKHHSSSTTSLEVQPILSVSAARSTNCITQSGKRSESATYTSRDTKSRNTSHSFLTIATAIDLHLAPSVTASTETSTTPCTRVNKAGIPTTATTTSKRKYRPRLTVTTAAKVYPAPPATTSAETTTSTLTSNNMASTLVSNTSTATTGTSTTLIHRPLTTVATNVVGKSTLTAIQTLYTSAALSSSTHTTGSSTTASTATTKTGSPTVGISVTSSTNNSDSNTSSMTKISTKNVQTKTFPHTTETTTTKGNTTTVSRVTFSDATAIVNESTPNTSLLNVHINDTKLLTHTTDSTTVKENTNSGGKSTSSITAPSGNESTSRTPPLVKIYIKKDKVMPEAFSHNLVVTFIVIYIFIIFLAFFGNLLVIFVITWARMVRSFTDLFIVSLAVSDILISTINMPIQLNLIVINEWKMGDFFCKFTHYLQAVTIVANILTLTAIAIDRYLVICHTEVSRKVHTKRFAILGLIIVWFVSLCVVCPQLIIQRIEPRIKIDFNTHDILGISHVCVETFPKPEKYDRKIFSLTIFVGAYLVPVFVMAFTYGAIAHRLWVQQPIGDIVANPRNHTRSIRQKRKVIKMLMLLVVAFTVLWFPFFTASLYQEFVETDSTFRITLVILQLVGYSNCCFNPIIYTFLNTKFQLEFRRIFCRRRRRIIASIHVIERRANSNSHSLHSIPHSVHSNPNSSSHNDVIVQGLKTRP